MNKESFINYIDNNHLLGKESIGDLTDLSVEFPYCSTIHILLAMNLQKEDHFRYDSELKRAAIYAADRSILRKHIEQLSKTSETAVLPDEDIELSEQTAKEVELIPELEEEIVEEIKELEEVAVDAKVEEEILEPAWTEPEELVESESDQELIDLIEETREVDKPQPAEINEVDLQQSTEKIDPEKEKVEEQEPEIENTLAELRKIVAGRLKQIEKERQAKKEIVEEVKQVEIPETVKPPKKKKQDKAISELIDNFIKTEPSITRRQAAFFDPVDAAKESVTDEENIVSETLADIYFGQRKFEKAIRVYKKLSLKFPEKSSYFAARIEKAVEELKK